MGQSPYARLIFGFVVGTDDEPPAFLADHNDSVDEYILAKAGLEDSTDWKLRNRVVGECIADVEHIGYHEMPDFVLCVRGLCHSVEWSETKLITPELLRVDPAKVAEFRRWCDENGTPWQEPGWLMSAYLG